MMGPNGPIRVADKHGLDEPYRVEAELRKTRRILDEGSPSDMSKYEIRAREKSIKLLEERISKKMIPEKQFMMKSDGGSEYRKVVNELVAQGQDRVLSADIESLKNLRRERNPDDPLAGSVEDLRKK
jgi:glutamyl-tRNA reductase